VQSGPYIVIPILGPSTLRDALVRGVELQTDPVRAIKKKDLRNGLYVTRVVDVRSTFLRAGAMMDEVALDRYTFMRDAYLQVRQREVLGDKAEGEANDPPDIPADNSPPAK
jgi:phospholipid-binding lipoprotein MlaA